MTATDTTTLTQWLNAQLDAEQADAERGRRHNAPGTYANDNYGCLLVDPARVLAQVAAHRAIVELHTAPTSGGQYDPACHVDGYGLPSPDDCDTLRALATIYADQPGFREEWR